MSSTLTPPPRAVADAHRRLRWALAAIGVVPLFVIFTVAGARRPADIAALVVFGAVCAAPHVLYVFVVRSRTGSLVVGVLLFAATAGAALWVASTNDTASGLPALRLPWVTGIVGFPAIFVERLVARRAPALDDAHAPPE